MDDGPATGNDGVDRISALPDDLLHAILSRLRSAVEVTRTAALSRRWRRVWIHARDLSLVDYEPESHDRLSDVARDAFAGFVDWVLAQRGDTDTMDSLHISTRIADPASPDQINAWIRYGVRRVAGDFNLRVAHVEAGPEGLPAIELPEHGRTRSISLHLSGPNHGIRFPPAAAGRYEALTALALKNVAFAEDKEGRGLCDFVSSCCPRLRTLYMENIWELTRLVLRAEALEEFTVIFAPRLVSLDMEAPNLRVFDFLYCYEVTAVRLVAPSLQEIDLRRIGAYSGRRPELKIHGLASVRRLTEIIELDVHVHYYHCDTIVSFWLLENCPRVQDVEVHLRHYEERAMNELDDLTLESAARFHNVRSMFVEANYIPEHQLVATVSSLLLRFPGLRSLRIKVTEKCRGDLMCFCHQLATSHDHENISLKFLEEVEISGLTGADEEMDLVTLMFNISPSIKSMTLHAALEKKQNSQDWYGDYASQDWYGDDASQDWYGDDALEPTHHKLIFFRQWSNL